MNFILGLSQLSSNSIRRDYYRGSQDSLAIRGELKLLIFIFSFTCADGSFFQHSTAIKANFVSRMSEKVLKRLIFLIFQ